jgi:hypothetical protein
MDKCELCNRVGDKICSKCHSVGYCSRECQLADWSSTHKFFCATLPFPSRETGDQTVYGFLLQEDGVIKIVNVKIIKTKKDLYEPDLTPHLDPNGTIKPDPNKPPFGKNYLPKKPIGSKNFETTLQISYRTKFLNDGSRANKCIQKITGNKEHHDWRGPMLLLKLKIDTTKEKIEPEVNPYIDMQMQDMTDMRTFFQWYG